MKCIKCEKKMKRCEKDGVLKGGVELIGYAHHDSKFDMGKGYHYNEIHLVVCDKCLSAFSEIPLRLNATKSIIAKGMKN